MSTYTPIASQTLSSATSSVIFSNIPQIYTDLVLVATVKLTSSNTDRLFLQFNGDTATNYSATYLQGDGSAAASGRFSSVSEMRFYNQSTADFYPNIIHIMNYANSTTYKTAIGRSSAAAISATATVGLWRSTAAITQVDVKSPNTFTSGSTFTLYGIDAQASVLAKATGGQTITKDANYWYHVFNSSGTFTPSQSVTADILVIAGGGGAGYNNGGGGGAGGLLAHNSQSLTSGTSYTITIGAGGVENTGNGSNSQFGSLTASVGGGGGGNYYAVNGLSGGSGGGGGAQPFGESPFLGAGNGGSPTSGQGNAGGAGQSNGHPNHLGGGGGGAGAAGTSAASGSHGGNGASTYSSWGSATGTGQNIGGTYWYAGGGGGGRSNQNGGTGGNGGGGNGGGNIGPRPGTANTGGGGGAQPNQGTGSNLAGQAGGSGIVIVRYPV
jgi:hypothetical protein